MNRYICLLRGINVGGHKKIKMADLKALFVSLGYNEVVTYIQSGNIIFNSQEDEIPAIAAAIQATIMSNYSFEVPILVLKRNVLAHVFKNYTLSQEFKESSYFTLLHTPAQPENIAAVNLLEIPFEHFVVTENCIYFYPEKGYGRAKGTNSFLKINLA